MNGVLLIDKPDGMTSAEVVRRVKRRVAVKVGHLGTLDPFATGVLPLCLGSATKIAQFLNVADKRYEGVIRLGTATDTGDRTGTVVRTAPLPGLDARRLEDLGRRFTGEMRQIPPMYSALKREGVPLYRLARQGIEVERSPRIVRVASFSLERCGEGRLRFDVSCSKGTYVRVLAQSVGEALGTAAHLESLRRTVFGRFSLGSAVELDGWDPSATDGMLSIRDALAHLPCFHLDERHARAARNGQASVLARLPEAAGVTAAVLLDPTDAVAAVVVERNGGWKYGRVFCPNETLQPESPVLITHAK